MARTTQVIDPSLEIYRKNKEETVLDRLRLRYLLVGIDRRLIIPASSSQARTHHEQVVLQKVAEYVSRYRAGSKPPPIIVKRIVVDGEEKYEVIDGVHRTRMYTTLDLVDYFVPAYVIDEDDITPDQEYDLAVEMNKHGLGLDAEELKAAAVEFHRRGLTLSEIENRLPELTKAKIKSAIGVDKFWQRSERLEITEDLLSSDYYNGMDTAKRNMVEQIDLDKSFIEATKLAADASLKDEEVRNMVRDIKKEGSEQDQVNFLTEYRVRLQPRIQFHANPQDRQAVQNLDDLLRCYSKLADKSAREFIPETKSDSDSHYISKIVEARKFLADILDAFDARP